MGNEKLSHLFEAYLAKTCTGEEKQQLAEIILEDKHNEEIDSLLLQAWEHTASDADMTTDKAFQIIEAILNGKKEYAAPNKVTGKLVWLNAMSKWKRAIAAAAIMIMLAGGGYLFFVNKNDNAGKMAIIQTSNIDIKPPKNSKASIILANGQTVLLDSIQNGLLAMQGKMEVMKTADGEIIYSGSSSEMQYNTLVNPRGSKVTNLTLSDGTKVWLNSESSLRYPVAFTGTERKVQITGEVYFEVAHDDSKRFLAEANGILTEVLGTHFNVNAYDDEPDVKVTLLEGAVKVAKGVFSSLLKPGQQAQIKEGISITTNADVEAVMAWKNGYFNFSNTSIENLLKQVSRWYDVVVVYEKIPAARAFGGEISRSVNLSQVVKILTESNVKCRIEADKLIVE